MNHYCIFILSLAQSVTGLRLEWGQKVGVKVWDLKPGYNRGILESEVRVSLILRVTLREFSG